MFMEIMKKIIITHPVLMTNSTTKMRAVFILPLLHPHLILQEHLATCWLKRFAHWPSPLQLIIVSISSMDTGGLGAESESGGTVLGTRIRFLTAEGFPAMRTIRTSKCRKNTQYSQVWQPHFHASRGAWNLIVFLSFFRIIRCPSEGRLFFLLLYFAKTHAAA